MAYMIHSLSKIISDMTSFSLVFTIFIVGFASSFYTLSDAYATPLVKDEFDSLKFSYEMALGAFDTAGVDLCTYFFFFVASILEVIIVLNLLIGIISDSFEDVTANAVVFSYRERTQMIRDCYRSVNPRRFQTHGLDTNMLFFAIDVHAIQSDSWLPAKTRINTQIWVWFALKTYKKSLTIKTDSLRINITI